ncbi:MAG TPA: protein kinase [Gemmatimonadaceae bacterium]|nr:protein kinase [Gemmatimonadaceae bacterium]
MTHAGANTTTSQLREHLQRALGDTYTVQRELGGGGMSRVFLAEEKAFGRMVVIKVLSPEKAEGLLSDRFTREIRLAANLQHPHIVPLFSAGTFDGLPYYTMPFVAGESLRRRLTNKTPISSDECIQILRDTARALEYAHAHGVVHRDIKPDNILLSGNSACVIDFGIAKALTAARTSTTQTNASGMITGAGFVVGTPGYMSPEQATGQGEVDGRADIYAFGCVAYEIFAGKPPFSKPTIHETLMAHIMETPKSGNLHRSDIPRVIADLIMSCLAKDAENRPQTASDLLRVIQGDGGRTTPSTPREPVEQAFAIAVLPFQNMSGEKENEYFADGITEEITNALTQIDGLRVVGRASSFVFKDHNRDLRAIGQQLGVTTVLEGSVRKSGNRLRITAQLVKTSDGYHLWSERYDREMTDVFAVQDEIATAIAKKLRLSLGERAGLMKPRTLDVEAYELFLKGRSLLYTDFSSIFECLECFQNAVDRDDQFAMAHAAIAETLLIAAYNGLMRSADVIERAYTHAKRGVLLDPESAESHYSLAFWYSCYGKDPQKTITEWEHAMRLGSQIGQIRCTYAIWGLCLGERRWDDAVHVIEETVNADPLNPFARSMQAVLKVFARRIDGVVDDARRGVELDPAAFWSNWALQRCYQSAGMHEESIRQGVRTLAMSGRHPWPLSELAVTYASLGQNEAADAIYSELAARNRIDLVQPTPFALAATCAGRLDEAIALGHRAVDERDTHIRWAALDDRWEGWAPLQTHPDWPALKERIDNW